MQKTRSMLVNTGRDLLKDIKYFTELLEMLKKLWSKLT